MAFEVRSSDLLARVGKLKTSLRSLDTPAFLPVVNPTRQPIRPSEMFEAFGCQGLTTNAYILKKRFEKDCLDKGVHDFLGFSGVVLTDSGAYQLLRYGRVDVEPLEIARFQEAIRSDMAVVLDVPTGWPVSRQHAEDTVDETIRRAAVTLEALQDRHALWVGPVQGGAYVDLVASAAEKMAKLSFDVYALGSPTAIMEAYDFETLVDMIAAAKVNLPAHKPLHLFGAGHPFMFSFAVALGCDLFDSASYALYARQDRYMTENGTIRVEDLQFLPCSCPVCVKLSASELCNQWKEERERTLARHNLHVCLAEMQRIKQAIVEGRLWELLELRARSHPALHRAFVKLTRYTEKMESNTPTVKRKGIFFFNTLSLRRPEVLSHHKRVMNSLAEPKDEAVLLLLPAPAVKPFHASEDFVKVRRILESLGARATGVDVCFYGGPFGLVPLEIDDVFPLSQYETTGDAKDEAQTVELLRRFLRKVSYRRVLLHPDPTEISRPHMNELKRKFSTRLTTENMDPWGPRALDDLKIALKETLVRRRGRRGATAL
ncbi:MAG: tRNA guanosine(15) transglycosylase TgtA [Candidatus Bathyarchaeia archaeon]